MTPPGLARWLFFAAIAGAGHQSLARAQTARPPDPAAIRIVVFQFTTARSDSALRVVATAVARSLVATLVRDPAFVVMSNPRARQGAPGRAAGGNAQYAVIGSVAELRGMVRIDARLVDIERVQLLVRETLSLTGADSATVDRAGAQLAAWVRDRLVPPSH
ncbi:MAG: hypothetical protein HY700_05035 [Gemmatimonadetes bacterium]|nr:hypothetical protein [Gemmatimonadota bacterium]